MDRKFYKPFVVSSVIQYGDRGSSPIDQTPSKSFNIDPATGRPMEEITRVMRAQTQAEMQNAFMNLNVFSSEYLPDDTSARDALKFMKPSLCQLPSELAEWTEALTQYQYDKKVAELQKEEDKKKAEEDAAAAAKAAAVAATSAAPSTVSTKSE